MKFEFRNESFKSQFSLILFFSISLILDALKTIGKII